MAVTERRAQWEVEGESSWGKFKDKSRGGRLKVSLKRISVNSIQAAV